MMSPTFQYSKGVRQGCNLNHFLFSLLISDLGSHLMTNNSGSIQLGNMNAHLLLFADDLALVVDSHTGLQTSINSVSRGILPNIGSPCHPWSKRPILWQKNTLSNGYRMLNRSQMKWILVCLVPSIFSLLTNPNKDLKTSTSKPCPGKLRIYKLIKINMNSKWKSISISSPFTSPNCKTKSKRPFPKN